MNNQEQQQRQAFFNEISNYEYFREDGRLILEPFCVYLSHCFGFDGILELSPQPRDVYMLLISMLREQYGDEDARKYIQLQNIADWRPELSHVFPERHMTCIHVAGLSQVSHYWIYDIGHSLIGIPESEEQTKYFAWVKEEWIAVFTFINGYHNALATFQKRADREAISKKGYSAFEALHLSRTREIEFDDAVLELKGRHDAYQAAMARITDAMKSGFFLEAISLQECLISNCLFNFLKNVGCKLSNPSFHTLLKEAAKRRHRAYEYPSELLDNLDHWRKERNTAIHGFISAASSDLMASREKFEDATKATALTGEAYCSALVSWYEIECVNFVRHEFPREQQETRH